MDHDPVVTVLMAVRNGRRYLRQSIESILSQSYAALELMVVDDASDDSSPAYLASVTDPRLRVVRNDRRLGLAGSLERGLGLASGTYVARMDADDIAAPERLERQVAFLNAHPEVGIVGSACTLIDEVGTAIGTRVPPLTDLAIRWRALTENPFLHPTVVFRRAVVCALHPTYDSRLAAAQDYELWVRLLATTRAANLAEPLVRYRRHEGGVTASLREEQLSVHMVVSRRAIAAFLPDVDVGDRSLENIRVVLVEGRGSARSVGHRLRAARDYLNLLEAFARQHADDPETPEMIKEESTRTARVVLAGSKPHERPLIALALRRELGAAARRRR